GDLLGDDQSGHIKETGVELYQQMLIEEIARVKNIDENHQASGIANKNYIRKLTFRVHAINKFIRHASKYNIYPERFYPIMSLICVFILILYKQDL
ncbi:MAG: hypothetical protein EBY20_10805, partial [Alphaproteobacteria bacterium]|nr:hypothetical protein [Alphaproteobacteria bacterium]